MFESDKLRFFVRCGMKNAYQSPGDFDLMLQCSSSNLFQNLNLVDFFLQRCKVNPSVLQRYLWNQDLTKGLI